MDKHMDQGAVLTTESGDIVASAEEQLDVLGRAVERHRELKERARSYVIAKRRALFSPGAPSPPRPNPTARVCAAKNPAAAN